MGDNLKHRIKRASRDSAKKMSIVQLTEMINRQLKASLRAGRLHEDRQYTGEDAYNIVLKQFKAPTEKLGETTSGEREEFKKYIGAHIEGTNLSEKIENINDIGRAEDIEAFSLAEILAALGALKMMQEIIADFNESTAGFLFEAFLAGLLGGRQVTEKVEGSLPIEDIVVGDDPDTGESGQAMSLKLLSPATKVHGSIVNLMKFFNLYAEDANTKGIKYLIGTKRKSVVGQDVGEVDIYSFTLKPSNFFDWVPWSHFEKYYRKIKQALDAPPEALQERETPGMDLDMPRARSNESKDSIIIQNKNRWEDTLKIYLPALGYDIQGFGGFGEIFTYRTVKGPTRWRQYILKTISSALKPTADRIASDEAVDFVLSEESEKAFDSWAGSLWSGPKDIDILDLRKVTALDRGLRRLKVAYASHKFGSDEEQKAFVETPMSMKDFYSAVSDLPGAMGYIDSENSREEVGIDPTKLPSNLDQELGEKKEARKAARKLQKKKKTLPEAEWAANEIKIADLGARIAELNLQLAEANVSVLRRRVGAEIMAIVNKRREALWNTIQVSGERGRLSIMHLLNYLDCIHRGGCQPSEQGRCEAGFVWDATADNCVKKFELSGYDAKKSPEANSLEAGVVERLTQLANSTDPEDIKKWAKAILAAYPASALHGEQTGIEEGRGGGSGPKTQFVIEQIAVITHYDSTKHGTVTVRKEVIQKALDAYADRLEELVFPIYDQLIILTDSINGYFYEGKASVITTGKDAAIELEKNVRGLSAGKIGLEAGPE